MQPLLAGGDESPGVPTTLGESRLALRHSVTSRPLTVAHRPLDLGTRPLTFEINSVVVLLLKAETPAKDAWKIELAAARSRRAYPPLKVWSKLSRAAKKALYAQLAVSRKP